MSPQVPGVAGGAALTRIYYKADPINGDRGLGNVGGENAFPDSWGGHVKYLGGSEEVTSETDFADPWDAPPAPHTHMSKTASAPSTERCRPPVSTSEMARPSPCHLGQKPAPSHTSTS